MNDSPGTDDAPPCPVCDAANAERIERGGDVAYRCHNYSAEFDAYPASASNSASPPVDEVREEFDYFAHCTLTEMACETAGEDGLTDLEIINAAYDSATTGERVSL